MPTFLLHFALLMFIIIVNNALLLYRLLERKKNVLYVIGLIILMILYSFLTSWYNLYIHKHLFHDGNSGPGTNFWYNLMIAVCFIIIASMLYVTQKWADQREQVKNIQINHLQTELKYLRSQINPHFLFNGLNTIYGYIDKNNHLARNMMVQFSDLLRYNLYEADIDFIELDKEVKYLQTYVAIQKARSNDNMNINLKIDVQNDSVKIAPLIFIVFIENAFKFVSRGDKTINTINILLKEEGGCIDFTCDNSTDAMESVSGGIGLNNVIRRLDILYHEHYQLDIKNERENFHVHLMITL
jgi:LytS/YehU family sensor histidine kinase